MRFGIRASIVGLALTVAACASTPTQIFTLTAEPPARPMTALHGGPQLAVAEVPLPAVIDRNEIVINEGNGKLDLTQNAAWAAPLGSLIRQALAADLQLRLGNDVVLSPGALATRPGLRILKVNIQQFMGSKDGRVLLIVDWQILRAGGSDVLAQAHDEITTEAGSGKAAALVPAMSRAVAELADRVAARVR